MLDFGSRLGLRLGKIGKKQHKCRPGARLHECGHHSSGRTLAQVPKGQQARLVGFCPNISASRRAQLLAYGLAPGYWVRVLQHSPVTVIQIEHTELAMEIELACEVQVEDPALLNMS